jgi:hypothetical protein
VLPITGAELLLLNWVLDSVRTRFRSLSSAEVHAAVLAGSMAQGLNPLVDHLDGLIHLADVAWRGPPEKYANLAYAFRRLGRSYEAAILNQRCGQPVRLRIAYKYFLKE